MNCPVCNRTLAPTLSICLTCGAMMNDSVREELQTRVGTQVRVSERLDRPQSQVKVSPPVPKQSAPAAADPSPRPSMAAERPKAEFPRPSPPLRNITSGFSGAKTNPTLVEFQNRNAAIPDWRLQLQNSVRQRKEGPIDSDGDSQTPQTRLVTSGAHALKAEVVEESRAETLPKHTNPKVANALKRINDSRKTFLPEEKKGRAPAKPAVAKNYPFNVVTRNAPPAPPRPNTEPRPAVVEPPKPTLVPTFKIEKRKYDTNKLPRIAAEPVQPANADKSAELPAIEKPETPIVEAKPEISIQITRSEQPAVGTSEPETIEDLAPISMRFNAGLFDLIIGGFASFVLVSPVVLIGGNWFSLEGVAAFGAVWAIVMFLYLTIAIGMYGKSLGMRMFGLELIDAEENDYPTFHQAAVNTAVYLLTLPFLGAGFIPLIFNEEQRAAHDLAAGTIIVAEF